VIFIFSVVVVQQTLLNEPEPSVEQLDAAPQQELVFGETTPKSCVFTEIPQLLQLLITIVIPVLPISKKSTRSIATADNMALFIFTTNKYKL